MRTALFVVLASFGFSFAVEAQRPLPDPLVGCYRLEFGSWTPALHPGNASYQTPPETLRLMDRMGTGVFERDRLLVRPTIPFGRSPSAFWERLGADSVRVVWTNGLAGVTLRLSIGGEVLDGVAQVFTDVPDRTFPETNAVATRIECDGDVYSTDQSRGAVVADAMSRQSTKASSVASGRARLAVHRRAFVSQF
jgi:hypothetical protein